MRKRHVIALLVLLGAPALCAQQPAPAPAPQQPANPPLEVGAMAPDFALPGSVRFGTLSQALRLSDFRGQTVVLAFYFRSRTRG